MTDSDHHCTNCMRKFDDSIEAADHILDSEDPHDRILEWVAGMLADEGLSCPKCEAVLSTEEKLKDHFTYHYTLEELAPTRQH